MLYFPFWYNVPEQNWRTDILTEPVTHLYMMDVSNTTS